MKIYSSNRTKIFKSIITSFKKFFWESQKILVYYTPKAFAHKWYFKKRTGRKLNLNNPQDFNEKMQWLIINTYGKEESLYADKLLVRDFVTKKGYGEILPQIYGVYNHAEEIDYNTLPNKFVLKANHGSGDDYYVKCIEKSELNINEVNIKLNNALKRNFAKTSFEYHYKYIEPKLFSEEFIESNNGSDLKDYKIFCFHGEPKYILVTSDRKSNLKRDYYDTSWNPINLVKDQYKSNCMHEKPRKLNEALIIARDLARDFIFVRVDLYLESDSIFFGELTLSPATGINVTYTDQALFRLGNHLNLKLN